MANEQIPPGMMLRSFLTVCSSIILTVIALIASMFIIGLSFFPEFKKAFDDDTLQTVMENNPEVAIPSLMFWIVVGVTTIACLAVGWYIIKTAPFSQFAHAIFVAILLFLYYLQMASADPPGKKSMTLIYMFVFPLAILIGAKLTNDREAKKHAVENQAELL